MKRALRGWVRAMCTSWSSGTSTSRTRERSLAVSVEHMSSIRTIFLRLIVSALQDYLIENWYDHIMEMLKGTQWILQWARCFAVTDGDIVLRPTNSNFNKRGPCTLFSRLTLFQLQDLVMTIHRPQLSSTFRIWFPGQNVSETPLKSRLVSVSIHRKTHWRISSLRTKTPEYFVWPDVHQSWSLWF